MDKFHFADWIRSVYANFGKAAPAQQIMAAIYRRVDGLPDGFFEYAASRLEDRETLPVNLGRELRRVLWPEYLEKNPGLRAREPQAGCNQCAGSGMPGIFWGYAADGHRHALPCVCNSLPSLAHLRHWTRADVQAAGLALVDPTMPVQAGGDAQPLQRPAVGRIADGRARERTRHLPEVERVDYGEAEAW